MTLYFPHCEMIVSTLLEILRAEIPAELRARYEEVVSTLLEILRIRGRESKFRERLD